MESIDGGRCPIGSASICGLLVRATLSHWRNDIGRSKGLIRHRLGLEK
ncbi:hypothetical protein [Chelatococcus sp.]